MAQEKKYHKYDANRACQMRFMLVLTFLRIHDDLIKWKHFPRYWPFVRGIHRSPVNSPHKGQWRGALMFSLICVCIKGWVNNREAGDLRRYRAHYDVTVMLQGHSRMNLIGPDYWHFVVNNESSTKYSSLEITWCQILCPTWLSYHNSSGESPDSQNMSLLISTCTVISVVGEWLSNGFLCCTAVFSHTNQTGA